MNYEWIFKTNHLCCRDSPSQFPCIPGNEKSSLSVYGTICWGFSVVDLFPRELIEGTPMDFLKANLRPHQRPDPRPKTRWAFNQLLREQIENSRDFLREQIHHTTPKSFQQIVILTKYLKRWSGQRSGRGFAWGKSWGEPWINSLGWGESLTINLKTAQNFLETKFQSGQQKMLQ